MNAKKNPRKGVESVTFKGQQFRIYFGVRKKNGRTYSEAVLAFIASGTRQRKAYTTREAALKAAKEIGAQLADGGGHAAALAPAELADARAALRILRPHSGASLSAVAAQWSEAITALGKGIPLLHAVEEYKRQRAKEESIDPILVPDAVRRFIEHLEREGASARYLEDARCRLGIVARSFQGYLHTVTTRDLADWLARLRVSTRTRKNYRTLIITLWRFSKAQGYLPRDRQTEPELLPSASRLSATKRKAAVSIGIYTPEEMARLLAVAPPDLAALMALGGFAGLRTAEISRLTWENIRPEAIEVPAEKAKTASRRFVPLLPCLTAWLARIPQGSGDEPVSGRYSVPSCISRAMRRTLLAAGIKPRPNGLRHSFISYRIAQTKNAPQTALEAGNSPQMIFSTYRELVTEAEAQRWFSIMPEAPENVLPLPRRKSA